MYTKLCISIQRRDTEQHVIIYTTCRHDVCLRFCSHFALSIVVNIVDGKPKTRYILAVDDSKSTLNEIVGEISTSLSTGKVKQIPKEEALLDKELSVRVGGWERKGCVGCVDKNMQA